LQLAIVLQKQKEGKNPEVYLKLSQEAYFFSLPSQRH